MDYRSFPHSFLGGRMATVGNLYPLIGWPLTPLGVLEQHRPGFSWKVMGRGAAWRHAVYDAFSLGLIENPGPFLRRVEGDEPDRTWAETLAALADTMLRLSPREIVEAVRGQPAPTGLLGAFAKLSRDPLPVEGYADLWSLFTDRSPDMRVRRRCALQLRELDERRLHATLTLDCAVLCPPVVDRMRSYTSVRNLNEQVALVRRLCSTASDEAMRESIARIGAESFLSEWLDKADRLLPEVLPTDVDPEIIRVTPKRAKAVGRAFRNCVGGGARTVHMVDGTGALIVIRDLDVLVDLALLEGGGWIATGIHAKGNGDVSPGLRRSVRDRLQPLGVVVPVRAEWPEETRALRAHLGRYALIDRDLDLGD